MESDEVQMRTSPPVHIVFLVSAMVEEQAQEFGGLGRGGTGAVWTANTCLWQRPQSCINRKVVELEIFLWRSLPISDVRLVPYFPKPGLNLGIAIAIA